jgi:lysophospholipase L1-like esterase
MDFLVTGKNMLQRISTMWPFRRRPFVYVAIGDSTVEGVGASSPHRCYTGILYQALKEKKKHVDYHNLGVAGATVKEVRKYQLGQAIELQPDLITLSVGANDIRKRTRLKQFERELASLLKDLEEKTHAKIIVNTIPDLSLTPAVPRYMKSYSRYMAQKLNSIIKAMGNHVNVTIVDLFNYSRAVLKQFPEAISHDGFHPSDFGYAIWANTMIPQMQHILTQNDRMR